jgi:histidyl-tRNA synthetase
VLLGELLETLGVTDTQLHLSSLGTPEARTEYREELKAYLHAREDTLAPEVRDRIDLNPLRAFDSTDPRTQETMRGAPKLLDRLAGEDLDHFERVRGLLDDAKVGYEVDPTLVRGLDYYTRTVFEFKSSSLGAQSTVGAGGRYDRLIELLEGPPTPATGWASGIERILLVAGELPTSPAAVDLYVAIAKPGGGARAFQLAREARRAGLTAQPELTGRSLKGQLKQADRIGAKYVAIIGEDAQVSLKEMDSGNQRELSTAEVIPAILDASRVS